MIYNEKSGLGDFDIDKLYGEGLREIPNKELMKIV